MKKVKQINNLSIFEHKVAFDRIKFLGSDYVKEAKKYSNKFNTRIENANRRIDLYVAQNRNGTYIDDYLG